MTDGLDDIAEVAEAAANPKLKEERTRFLEDVEHDRLRSELANTNIPRLLNDNYVDQLAQKYNGVSDKIYELKNQLQALSDAAHESFYDLYTNENGKFRSKLLGEDIKSDFNFVTIRDSEQFLIYRNGYWQPKAQTFVEEMAKKRLGIEYKSARKGETVDYIKSSYTDREDFQTPERILNLGNGAYHIDTGELEPHKPEHNFQYKIPFNYKPDAECPEITEFLHEIVETEEQVQTIIQYVGYLILPDTPKAKSVMLAGPGSNGKTILMDVIKELLSSDNYTNKSLQDFSREFDMAHIDGSLAITDDDLSPRAISPEASSRFKKITGGSDIGAEIKFGDHYDFQTSAKFLFAANQIPPTKDQTDGFFRRWIIIDFPYKFLEDPDPEDPYQKQEEDKQQLLNRLTSEEELEGLLRKAIDGLEDVLETNQFAFEPDVETTRDLWLEHSTPVVSFIKRFVEQGKTKGEEIDRQERTQGRDEIDFNDLNFDYITKETFQRMISAWSKERGEGRVSKKDITNKLNNQFDFAFNPKTRTRREPGTGQTRVYSGLKLVLDRTDNTIPDYLFQLMDEDSNESVLVTDGEDKTLKARVKEYLSQNYSREPVGFDDFLGELVEEEVITESEVSQVEEKINEFKDSGFVFEPSPGQIQVL